MANISDEADISFRREVIKQLVDSVDCTEHLKTLFQQFLGNITTHAKHKDLAYHLFLTTTLYISKKVNLDEEQMSVICRTVEQLRQEWNDGGASSKHSSTLSHTRESEQDHHNPGVSSVATSLRAEPEDVVTPAASNVAEGDVGSICGAFERIQFSRSTTPDSFVREIEKHVLVTHNFHEAIKPKDAAELSSQYPWAYKLMSKQGWSNRSGLGPDGSGIQRPIDAYALVRYVGDSESSAGIGFASTSGSKAPTNGNHTEKPEKQTNEFAVAASPWHQYAADPYIGDKSAKNGYRNNAMNTAQRDRIPQEAITQPNGNMKTDVQDGYVVKDIWKDASKRKSTHHIQKNAPHGSSWEATKAPPNTNGFSPCTDTSKGW